MRTPPAPRDAAGRLPRLVALLALAGMPLCGDAEPIDLLADPGRIVPLGRVEPSAHGVVLHAAPAEESAIVAWPRRLGPDQTTVRVEHGAIPPFFRLLVFFRNGAGLHVEDVTSLTGTALRDLARHPDWDGSASEIGLLLEPAYPGATGMPAPAVEVRAFRLDEPRSAPALAWSRTLAYEGWSGRSINILPRAPLLPLLGVAFAALLLLALGGGRRARPAFAAALALAALPVVVLAANMLRQQGEWRALGAVRAAAGQSREIDWELIGFAAELRAALAAQPGAERVLIDVADPWTGQRLRRHLLPVAAYIAPTALATTGAAPCTVVVRTDPAQPGHGTLLLARSPSTGPIAAWATPCAAAGR